MQVNTSFDPAPFVTMMRSEGGIGKLLVKVQRSVLESIQDDEQTGRMLIITGDEVKRRSDICFKWFRVLRCDMGYSVDRALDFIPYALRKDLNGEHFEPPAKESPWAPEVLHRRGNNGS